MKTNKLYQGQERPNAKSSTAKFKATKATKDAANEIALKLGWGVLHYIAIHLGSRNEPRFSEGGSPTDQTKAELFSVAVEGFKDAVSLALLLGELNRDVVNHTRTERGLDPVV